MENLANHLLSSVLKVIGCMYELEALEKKGYIQKSFRKRGRKHSYNDISFIVPHYVIEALRKADLEQYIGSESRMSEILNRKRKLALGMIKSLYKGLKIPAESLLV